MAWYRCVGGAGGSLKLRTASGAIATFNTNMVEPFKSLKSDINPVQDLHGYSKPWSGGGGKNKLNYEAWKTVSANNGTAVFENNGITLTATLNDCYTSAPNGFPVDARIPVTEGETITLSWQESTNATGMAYIFPNNTTTGMVYVNNSSAKKLSYTATSGVTFVTFRLGVANSGTTIAYKNIQIEKGNQATAYEPYSNICPISGFTEANITRCGVNLWDEEIENGNISTSTGKKVGGGIFKRSVNYNVCDETKPVYGYSKHGKQLVIYWYDKAYNYLGFDVIINTTKIPPTNAKYFLIRIDAENQPFVVGDISINYPSTDTTYHPYNGQTYTISFGQTVYGGVADVTNGKVEIDFANDRLDAKTWSYNSSRVAFNATFSGKDQTRFAEIICSCYVNGGMVYSASEIASKPDKAFYTQNNSDTIFIKDSDYTDTTTWLNALGSNTICYPLATPIEITTTPENLTAISGENNVFSDTNGDTEVKYLYRE